MAAIAKKKYTGQSGELGTGTSDNRSEPYVVTGATSPADARAAAVAEATANGEATIVADGITLVIVGASHEFLGQNTDGSLQAYEVTLRYGASSIKLLDLGDVRVNYDTSGGTFHTLLAKSERVYGHAGLLSGTNGVSFNMVVGNQPDGADGCDAPVSDFHLSVTVVFDATAASGTAHAMPDHNDVFRITGRTNDADFAVKDSKKLRTYSFLAGEMTFEGASEPDARPDGYIEMTFKFHCSPNITNITIGSGSTSITGVDKKGSEYLWLRYEKTGDNITALLPKYAVVNEVVYNDDFSLLNIPVP